MTYNQTHLSMLNEGVDKWNAWRADYLRLRLNCELASLPGAIYRGINLQRAILTGAELSNAMLENAKLQEARLDIANLEGARLKGALLENASLKGALLGGADLRAAFLGNATNLEEVCLCRTDGSGYMTSLVDIDWASVNLGAIDWETVQEIGYEQQARQKPSTENYRAATRAYRQLAVELRNQGMGEEGDRFADKAQLLQRIVYRRQKKWSRFATSLFLDKLAGYGYKPIRSFYIYIFIVLFFAMLYCIVPNHSSIQGPLSSIWWQALLFSILSVHGRIPPPTSMNIDYTFTWLAAIEAILGLLIEITFIAAFTQRFFAKETC